MFLRSESGMLRSFPAGLILDVVSDEAWWQHMRLPKHLFSMSILGVLYGVGHVSPRKVGKHVTRHLKITTHFLTCTAPRVLRGVFAPPRVAGVHTASETFARGQVGPFLSGWKVDRLRVE